MNNFKNHDLWNYPLVANRANLWWYARQETSEWFYRRQLEGATVWYACYKERYKCLANDGYREKNHQSRFRDQDDSAPSASTSKDAITVNG